jgi:hypothetical protein
MATKKVKTRKILSPPFCVVGYGIRDEKKIRAYPEHCNLTP